MKSKVCILICVLSLIIWSCSNMSATSTMGASQPQDSALNLTLSLDKNVYKSTEFIKVSLSLGNVGDERVVVKKRLAPNYQFLDESVRDVVFLIKDPHGNTVVFNGYSQVPALRDDYFIVLGPNESFEHIYSDIKAFYDLSEPGEYTIQAIYENKSDPSNNWVAWKGTLLSNVVTFTIEP